MHLFNRYGYLLYWTLVSQGLTDNQIALATDLTPAFIGRVRRGEVSYFGIVSIEKLERVVDKMMGVIWMTEN